MQLAIALAIIASVLLPGCGAELLDGPMFGRMCCALGTSLIPILFARSYAKYVRSSGSFECRETIVFAKQMASLERLFLVTWVLATIVVLGLFRWDLGVRGLPICEGSMALSALTILFPILGPVTVFWFVVARLEEQYCLATGEQPLDARRHDSLRAVWFQSRQMILLPAIPVFAILITDDALRFLPEYQPFRFLIWGAVVGLLPLVLPTMIRKLWRLESFPDGARRNRINALIVRAGVSVADICLWRTGGRCINAAVAGAFKKTRILLLTDALADSFDDDDLDAVVAHEMAHIKHRHVSTILLSLVVAGLVAILCVQIIEQNGWQAFAGNQISLVIIVPVFCGWIFVHRYISRTFEHHADLEACRQLSSRERAIQNPSQDTTAAAVDVFLRMLRKLAPAGVAGSDWWHPSIECRIATVTRIHVDIEKRDRFEEKVVAIHRMIRGGIAFLTLVIIGLCLINA